ncbi:molybdate transport system regulatory protein [Gramella sp. Hel_I_59]|uniref:winged helix-turn-helix domain-containing protein n=1 Tax=Gramella sp. Hel_I_59 TaxID=1249978 RepID=UPI0011549252|nr:LysR family transcriptional regulator [Gramella sp. Hel_I_59]TQI70475.1 molybdate transport system regulatory protein [Gramella sp. Hel_I_59]
MKSIKVKCWIETSGDKFYGPGPHELLRNIKAEGSLSKAAEKMQLSYRKAWEMIRQLNMHSEQPLVILRKGGKTGGGAEVTMHAQEVMEAYNKLQQKLQEVTEEEKQLLKILN